MTTDKVLMPLGIAGGVIAGASALLFALAIGFDPAAGAELVARIHDVDPDDAVFVRWGALTDMLGYYLIPAAVIVLVRNRLPWTSPGARDLATGGGLMYATIGAIGAAALAAAGPPLIGSADLSAPSNLTTLVRIVEGLWQWLEPLPFLVWTAGVSLALRSRSALWSRAFLVLAVGAVVVWIGRVLGIEPVLTIGLVLWLFPFPFVLAAAGVWGREVKT